MVILRTLLLAAAIAAWAAVAALGVLQDNRGSAAFGALVGFAVTATCALTMAHMVERIEAVVVTRREREATVTRLRRR